MKNLRKYLLICMKEEPELPSLLGKVTENRGHSKILDYNTHSVAIINTDMMFMTGKSYWEIQEHF